jgi:hypothetical protein
MKEQDKVFGDIPPLKRVEIVKWILGKVDEHMRHQGTYRYLIYNRLGFGPEAYQLLLPEGMNVSNKCADINISHELAITLGEILIELDPDPDTKAGKALRELVDLIVAYETDAFPELARKGGKKNENLITPEDG